MAGRAPTTYPLSSLALQHRICLCIQTFLLTAELGTVTRKSIKLHLASKLGVQQGVEYTKAWLKEEARAAVEKAVREASEECAKAERAEVESGSSPPNSSHEDSS